MADEFEEIYGILLEEVTADDDAPAEAETVEMLIEIAQRDDPDDPEVGCMSAWLNTRLGEPSDRVRQKTLRMITQCVTEGEAVFLAAAKRDTGATVSALAAEPALAADAGACLAALGESSP